MKIKVQNKKEISNDFKIGDRFHLSNIERYFGNGYTPSRTEEIFFYLL
jgi:hypothetical protein